LIGGTHPTNGPLAFCWRFTRVIREGQQSQPPVCRQAPAAGLLAAGLLAVGLLAVGLGEVCTLAMSRNPAPAKQRRGIDRPPSFASRLERRARQRPLPSLRPRRCAAGGSGLRQRRPRSALAATRGVACRQRGHLGGASHCEKDLAQELAVTDALLPPELGASAAPSLIAPPDRMGSRAQGPCPAAHDHRHRAHWTELAPV